ncbi:MAG: T9SS type A sorting domain-containing protein, partial [Bacteroidales bacterium]|nr:T9SS type A sorting domain-containing protein [Bacteroidales bacterium]
RYGDSTFQIGTTNGTYPVHFTLPTGCDSLVNLALYINPSYAHNDTLLICESELPLTYGDSTFIEAGNYDVYYTSINGCDSLVELNLIVNPTYAYYDTLTICSKDLPYYYGTTYLNAAGNYIIYLNTVSGCDSTIYLNFNTPNCQTAITESICSSELPYFYGDSIFYSGGIYLVVFRNYLGNDSVVALTLKVYNSYNIYDTIYVCNTQYPFTHNDTLITKEGNYLYKYSTYQGCDSLFHMSVITLPYHNIYDTITICDNKLPYVYSDSTYYTEGNHTIHLQNMHGCDSVINLTLFISPTYETWDTISVCSNELPYYYGDSVFSTHTISGKTHLIHFTSEYQCDSLVNLTLYIMDAYIGYDTLSVCESELPYHYGDSIFDINTINGTYSIYFTAINTCDSLIRLTLTIHPNYLHYDTISICESELPYHYGDSIFDINTISGNYSIIHTLGSGCDSTINLHLTILPSYTHFDSITLQDIDLPYQYGDSIFVFGTPSGDYPVIFSTINGCDSTIWVNLTIIPTHYTSDTANICDNELPYMYNNQLLDSAGTYIVTLVSSQGGDSIVALTLFVYPTYEEEIHTSICDNELPYSFANETFDSSGVYNIALNTIHGCDSIIILHLNVKYSPTQPDTIFGLNHITESGQYTYHVSVVDSFDTYNWNISNDEWIGSSQTNVISIFISTPNTGIISVKTVNECGESETTELLVNSTIGIKEAHKDAKIEIYPNPANNYFYIKTSDFKEVNAIRITDVSGKSIYYEEINTSQNIQVKKIDISTYAKGFYYVSIIGKSTTTVKKLIKE